jgi:hypothetical protein
VRVVPLPEFTPHLKGAVETLKGAVERMLFTGLPRYTHAQTLVSGAVVHPGAPALMFEALTAESAQRFIRRRYAADAVSMVDPAEEYSEYSGRPLHHPPRPPTAAGPRSGIG